MHRDTGASGVLTVLKCIVLPPVGPAVKGDAYAFYREPSLNGPALTDRPVLGPSSIKLLRWPAREIARPVHGVGDFQASGYF